MHTKIWWSYVHIRYLVHVQKWTYLALGWPYGWALNINQNYNLYGNLSKNLLKKQHLQRAGPLTPVGYANGCIGKQHVH